MASGLSKVRLQRLSDAAKASVDKGENVGLIALVERRGETHVEIVGQADRERAVPMKRDVIFRMMSSSKPITAAAAMILVEEGELRLDEPIDRLIPELANRRVLKAIDGPLEETVPANRPITLRDCLTFRLGHGMMGFGPATTPFQKALNEAGLGFGGAGYDSNGYVKRLGSLPLAHQPGERVLYNTGSDVTGVLIERASGMSFEKFLTERLFEPLGMKDTTFSVPANKIDRLAGLYAFNPQTREITAQETPQTGRYSKPPAFQSGGGGLVSTLDDYLAFARMMLCYGRAGKERVLSRPSVETMTTNYLTDEQRRTSGWFPGSWDGRGWGLGVAVIIERLNIAGSIGRFGWDGAFGTQWSADPEEGMNCILMVQRAGSSFGTDFLTLAYQAIDD
jgi:CubicO group peptidase (beta-lactamase class C family)